MRIINYKINFCFQSANSRTHPIIDPKYFDDPTDLTDLIAAVRLTREIFAQEAFDQFRGPEKLPGVNVQTDEEIANWIKETCETEYHPCSSNKMGKVIFKLFSKQNLSIYFTLRKTIQWRWLTRHVVCLERLVYG